MVHHNAEVELLIDDENEPASEIEANKAFLENFSISIDRYENLLGNYINSNSTAARQLGSPSTSKTRLLKLQLLGFTGSYTNWMSLTDLFKASVVTSLQLKVSEKLNYLKARLKKDAAELNVSVTVTDANHQFANRNLYERYGSKRCIVQAHLNANWTQPTLKK